MAALDNLTTAFKQIASQKSKPKVPTFTGRGTKKETSYEEWSYILNKLKDNRRDYDLSISGLENMVFSSIVSEARTHYIRLDREGNSLNEILDSFKSIYTDQTNKFDRMKAFHALERHKNQSVDEFAEKFDRISYWTQETASAYMKDKPMLKFSFIKALTNQCLHDVLLIAAEDEKVTFTVYRSNAIMLDKVLTEKRPVKSIKEDDKISKLEERITEFEIALQKTTRPKTNCDYCKTLGHSAGKCCCVSTSDLYFFRYT